MVSPRHAVHPPLSYVGGPDPREGRNLLFASFRNTFKVLRDRYRGFPVSIRPTLSKSAPLSSSTPDRPRPYIDDTRTFSAVDTNQVLDTIIGHFSTDPPSLVVRGHTGTLVSKLESSSTLVRPFPIPLFSTSVSIPERVQVYQTLSVTPGVEFYVCGPGPYPFSCSPKKTSS